VEKDFPFSQIFFHNNWAGTLPLEMDIGEYHQGGKGDLLEIH
jgi:hypothetical protein